MIIKNFFERITGLDKIKKEAAVHAAESIRIAREAELAAKEANQLKLEAEAAAKEAAEQAKLNTLTPKDLATRKKEPWINVIKTHVNNDNIRNGFFELDWNDYFIVKLKNEGYGAEGDPDEEIVDRWFRELCANIVVDGDYGGPLYINTGVVDINSIKQSNL